MLKTTTNSIAGQRVAEPGVLSDGIFAVDRKLRLLDHPVPARELIRSEGA